MPTFGSPTYWEEAHAEFLAKKLAEFGLPKMVLYQGVALGNVPYEDTTEYLSEVFIDKARAQGWVDAFDRTRMSDLDDVEYFVREIEVY